MKKRLFYFCVAILFGLIAFIETDPPRSYGTALKIFACIAVTLSAIDLIKAWVRTKKS